MRQSRGNIRFELVFGIFLLAFFAISISFVATIKIQEKQRIEIENFNLQRVFYDIQKNPPAEASRFTLYLPSGTYFGLYDLNNKSFITGRELLTAAELKDHTADVVIGKDHFYPTITMSQQVLIGGKPHLLTLQKDFDAEKGMLRRTVYTFAPFAFVCLLGLTGFVYAFYRIRFLNPFEKLKKVFRSVSESSLHASTPRVRIREWDTLFSQFDEMTGKLSEYEKSLVTTIDELSKTNVALKTAQEEIIFSEKMATVGRLAAGLAHEIGNPLTSIMGNISFMAENAKTFEDKSTLNMILGETERINRIIRDLLNFARARQDEGAIAVCDPRAVIEDTIKLLQPQKDFKCINFINNVHDNAMVCFGAEELKQVLLNLIINAIDVSPREGCVTITSTALGDNLNVSVYDEGGGISKEIGDKVFEPFFTTKPAGMGTGLGLSVVHTLAQKYGGSVTFENTGTGAVFHLRLKKSGAAAYVQNTDS